MEKIHFLSNEMTDDHSRSSVISFARKGNSILIEEAEFRPIFGKNTSHRFDQPALDQVHEQYNVDP
ncbi:hypothetical protein J2T56_000073 [Natronobacillus azotifigens]